MHNDQYFVVGIGSYTESSEICVDVNTTDDDVSEGTETQSLGLLLSTNVAWVILSIPHDTTAEVIILDNDGEPLSFLLQNVLVIILCLCFVNFKT